MDIRTLQLFHHLAQSLHFGKTAQAMFITPSTLSRAITRLEQETQATLFERNNRSVSLTHAGEIFLVFASNTLAEWERVNSQLQSDQTQLRGELSLYCSVTAAQSHLPGLLDKYRSLHPNVDLKLLTGDPAEAVQRVQQKSTDAAVCIHYPEWPEDVTFQHLDNVPLVLIAPKSSKIQRLKDVDWTQQPVIMPESGPSRRIVHQWFAEHNIRPRIYATVGGNEAIVSMVNLGVGLGFVPKIILDYVRHSNRLNQITVPDIEAYQLGLCCLATRAFEPKISAIMELTSG